MAPVAVQTLVISEFFIDNIEITEPSSPQCPAAFAGSELHCYLDRCVAAYRGPELPKLTHLFGVSLLISEILQRPGVKQVEEGIFASL